MSTYNTGNPLGSTEVKDLYDNAQNLDNLVNGPAFSYSDRFGVARKSWAGMEEDFQEFLVNSGYEFIGDYDSGPLNITARNQIFTKDGEFWRADAALVLPYTTVENWAVDQTNFVSVGDAALRQELAQPDGATLVGWARTPLADAITTVSGMLDAQHSNIWEFASAVVSKPNPLDPSTWDWTPALQAAFDVGGALLVPSTWTGRVTAQVTATVPLILFAHGATVVPEVGGAGGKVFAFETDDVTVDGLTIDGTGLATLATTNHYAFFSGDAVTKFKNHTYRNCTVRNWNYSDGLTGNNNLITSHCFYVDNVDNVLYADNVVDTAAGAAFFCRDVVKLTITRNQVTDSIWYPIHLVGGCIGFEVSHNLIVSNTLGGIYWGGAIDLMSQHIPLEVRNRDGVVAHNTIRGTLSYGAAIRALSCDNVWIHHNVIRNWSVGAWAAGPDTTGIRVDTRGTVPGTGNGPVQNVNIFANEIAAPAGAEVHRGIYVSNSFQTARVPARGIWVRDNNIESNSLSSYFANAIIFHGQEGGIEDIHVWNNTATTVTGGSTPVPGAIGFIATNAQGEIDRVSLGANHLRDIGTPAGSAQVAYALGQFVDHVDFAAPSSIANYFYALRSFASSGPSLYRLENFSSIGNTNRTLLGVPQVDLFEQPAVPPVASASALPLPQFEGPSKAFTVTGTTTINSITATGHAGKMATLIFAAGLQVNDGGNLRLSAVYNTTADDTLTIVCDGTNWFEVGRSGN